MGLPSLKIAAVVAAAEVFCGWGPWETGPFQSALASPRYMTGLASALPCPPSLAWAPLCWGSCVAVEMAGGKEEQNWAFHGIQSLAA